MSKSRLYPHLFLENYANRQQNSSTLVENLPPYVYTNVMLDTVLSYEVDAWGSIRNTVAATKHMSNATRYDLAAIDLNLHTTLAKLYYQLAAYDAQQIILNDMVVVFKKNMGLVNQMHQDGLVSAFGIDLAKQQLEQSITDATNIKIYRAQTQHAIAVMIGKNPSTFILESTHYPFQIPKIDPKLPSQLMTQRPDLAAYAERVQGANATIGVARAAFLPVISISGLAGYMANSYNNILSAPNLIWSLGPRSASGAHLPPALFSQVIFDGFNLLGQLKKAKATYREIVAEYRQNVLKAFQQVEDRLVAIHRLEEEEAAYQQLTKASYDAFQKAILRQEIGMYSTPQVLRYQINYLNAENQLIQIRLARQIETIGLIDALGGGWEAPCIRCLKRQAFIPVSSKPS